VVWFLRERRWRVLGLTFVVFFVLMEVVHGKNYYLFPMYPMALAAGGCDRAVAGEARGMDASGGGRGDCAGGASPAAVGDVDAASGTATGVYEWDRLQTGEAGGETRVAVAAGDCRSVWMAGVGE